MKGSEGHQINLHACQNDTQSSQFQARLVSTAEHQFKHQPIDNDETMAVHTAAFLKQVASESQLTKDAGIKGGSGADFDLL